jgi:carboxypeptidase family protein
MRWVLVVVAACSPTPSAPRATSVSAAPSARCTVSGHGAIEGHVERSDDHSPLAGVTVVVSAPCARRQWTEISDDRGEYAFRDLGPGDYTISLFYGDLTKENSVVVHDGEPTRLQHRFDAP